MNRHHPKGHFPLWFVSLALLTGYALCAWVEPCDGHGCTKAELEASR